MRPKREYIDYLRDILDAAEKAGRFVQGIDFETFQGNDEKVFAVIRALEIIGEAGKKIPGNKEAVSGYSVENNGWNVEQART